MDYFPHRDPLARAKRLVHQLTHLGFEVQLRAQQMPALPGDIAAPATGS